MGEARLSAYEAFCGIAAKYEAPQMRYEAKPFQASCFFCLEIKAKKWRLEFFIATRYSEQRFELKNSEFRCEIKF